MPIRAFRSDADGPAFIGQQLQYIYPRIVEIVYGPTDWAKHLPLETGNNPAVEQMGFDIYSAAGMAELFRGDGWNLPEVGVSRERVLANVYDFGVNRTMTDLAVEQSALEAQRLRDNGIQSPITIEEGKERAAAEAINQRHNEIALFGQPALNIYGLVNQPNVSTYAAIAGESGETTWENKTGAEIVQDMTALVSLVMNTAKLDVWYPDRLVLPLNKYLTASTKQMPGTLETALSFFQRTNPLGNRLRVESWQRLNGQGPSGSGIAFCYKFDDEVLSYRSPRAYFVHTPPARAPAAWTWTHSMRSAGVAVKRPFAVAKMTGF